jgi:predicted RNA-binding protein with PUA-like domain
MAHWLMKSEPDVFGWDDLVEKHKRGETEQWHGVRNFTARNNMMAMTLDDEAFFYHSNIGKEIVGIMKVVALAHPDSTAEPNEKGKIVWQCVDVAPVRPFKRPVTLAEIKAKPRLADMALVRLSRLSVSPVTDAEWALICEMGGL